MGRSIDLGRVTLVLHLRAARRKARDAAAAELVALLADLGGARMPGGPLSEVAGVEWVSFNAADRSIGLSRLRRLGYTEAIDVVDPVTEAQPHGVTARWRGEIVSLTRVYSEPTSAFRDAAPDRRDFLLECGDSVVRRINGYRGSAGDLEHRALPVVDARLLANSVGFPKDGARLLDPFAGAGGVATAAREAGWKTSTSDIDPRLRFGLKELADEHSVADARELPWADSTFDAIASEPPYHPSGSDAVVESLHEIARVLAPSGRAALLVAASQRDQVADAATRSGLSLVTQADVSRKNTPVTLQMFRPQAR